MEHENDPDIDEPYVPPAGNVLGGEPQSLPSTADSSEGQEGQESFEGMSLKGQERKATHRFSVWLNIPLDNLNVSTLKDFTHWTCKIRVNISCVKKYFLTWFGSK